LGNCGKIHPSGQKVALPIHPQLVTPT